jgi:phosphopentomutase
MNNFIILVLDGVGVGELPDAGKYGDEGSNTLGNLADCMGGLSLPNLQQLGLGNIIPVRGVDPADEPLASYGKMNEVSLGKDSTSGHWEIGGLNVDFAFPYYPEGFPDSMIKKFLELTGLKGVLGNKPASGTEIIKELGKEHINTGFPIVYTSADSVFQIAAHEEVIPLEKLYGICKIARHKLLVGKDSVGRVIARPFIGEPGNFSRTTNRKDFSINPTSDTILNYLQNSGIHTTAIGKVNDLFNYSGITESVITKSNREGVEQLLKKIGDLSSSLIFINLVDFDVYYGHRNDPEGFNKALEEFDEALPQILGQLDDSDHMIITADHGNDPTGTSTDHTREYVPLLYYKKNKSASYLGIRSTFADIAQTAAHFFRINNTLEGTSFLNN